MFIKIICYSNFYINVINPARCLKIGSCKPEAILYSWNDEFYGQNIQLISEPFYPSAFEVYLVSWMHNLLDIPEE